MEVIINPNVDGATILDNAECTVLTEKERHDVLALRGLLGCQLLAHGLQMRHLVDYGVSR